MRRHMLHDKDGRAEVSRQHRKELGKRNGTARRNTHKDDRRTGPASRPGRRRNRLLLDTGGGNWQGQTIPEFLGGESNESLSCARALGSWTRGCREAVPDFLSETLPLVW